MANKVNQLTQITENFVNSVTAVFVAWKSEILPPMDWTFPKLNDGLKGGPTVPPTALFHLKAAVENWAVLNDEQMSSLDGHFPY